mmetsp:Transcript_7462/g.23091  ORF Transcript_7462/g.23091 Transcript_7462/m.23091 type:complete len:156 (+) Transcript_7462:195-662(+)|eukprot:scaffold259638_cov37-Tisochrysis_lutea.AAC.4
MKRVEALVRTALMRPNDASVHLRLLGVYSLSPDELLLQDRREHIAALWLFPSSAPVCVAHRRLQSRTQMRHILQPGQLLQRNAECCVNWAISIAPLRIRDLSPGSSNETRRIAVFTNGSDASDWSDPFKPLVFHRRAKVLQLPLDQTTGLAGSDL